MLERILLLSIWLWCGSSYAQITHQVNGVYDKNHNYYTFINAVIHKDYKTIIPSATLIIKDGKIINLGKDLKVPNGSVVYDMKGKHIYPSFIDMYSDYGVNQNKNAIQSTNSRYPQRDSNKNGAYNWNQAIHPEVDAVDNFVVNNKQAKELRKMGFGSVLTHYKDGIMRGTSTLVSLADKNEHDVIVKGKAANQLSFQKGSSRQRYPSSLMGAIALIRQNYLDAKWYEQNKGKVEYNISLAHINENKRLPNIFKVNNYLDAIRAHKIAEEFKIDYIIKAKEDLYKRVKYIKDTKANFIVSVNYPKAYDVTNLYDEKNISLEQLKHWETAPYNLVILEKNNIPFVITSADLKDKKSFLKNIRKSIHKGLSKEKALEALTHTPAKLLKVGNKLGSLHLGKIANFFISSDDIFSEKAKIYENWVQGEPYQIKHSKTIDIRGKYTLGFDDKEYTLNVSGGRDMPTAKVIVINNKDTVKTDVKLHLEHFRMSFHFNPKDNHYKKVLRFAGSVNDLSGKVVLPNGVTKKWNITKIEEYAHKEKEKKQKEYKKAKDIPTIYYPNMAYGVESKLSKQNMLIKNVTVWTNEKEGILKNADVLIRNGKIVEVGKDISESRNVQIVDGTGKHLTPGIIDEHSHIAINRGVNESTQASSAEVRIGDVVNSDDINIYRQLSGGVVASQLLHGSANPIGGQSAIIKLKWGQSPQEMKIKGADGFIKFALGENVKQSNWGDYNRIRFPQTRMGVEQVYYDAFIRAKEYDDKMKTYRKMSTSQKRKAVSPRRDLDLECLAEVLNSKRFITCHSYIQSEINMLMHVADSMSFKVNTFTHILEGYKVADKMKKHGVGGSTFSDWWAYKYEVNDAIPYNAAIMHNNGVVTAINSDDAEMARRLNQEAAKAVKYGGVSQEDALKMVTLNPAKLLHLDHRMGSIKKGKDADIVLWSGNPLSIYSKAEKTIIEGVIYFDIERDKELRNRNRNERNRIISKMLNAKNRGEKTQKVKKKKQILYHCDTEIDEY